jgi:hypothetical protein
MTRFAGPVRGQWYDPVSGTYFPVSGSPFSNKRSDVHLTTPSPSTGGQPHPDWVLVLTAG